ncbi:hypothetical protein GWI33_011895 [Rhynchophorus ferrugineus]|uniref:Uncharacterized protein n=1 Tax=Rhynchophorus ferrugineus TaxID=354439 RepID=A0A834MCU8_RHYFE|nr:hypothetical protein GWI33_011895 [Rhynchophorus ferrugineus]
MYLHLTNEQNNTKPFKLLVKSKADRYLMDVRIEYFMRVKRRGASFPQGASSKPKKKPYIPITEADAEVSDQSVIWPAHFFPAI